MAIVNSEAMVQVFLCTLSLIKLQNDFQFTIEHKRSDILYSVMQTPIIGNFGSERQ